jgi:hypothetical protein
MASLIFKFFLWNQICHKINFSSNHYKHPVFRTHTSQMQWIIPQSSPKTCAAKTHQVAWQPEDLGTELSRLVSQNIFKILISKHIKQCTSSTGPGREAASLPLRIPTIYGVGDKQISNREVGKTGINVCCQENGYRIDWRASTQDDKRL